MQTIEAAAGIDTRQQFKIDTLDIALNLRLASGVLKESYSGGGSFLRPTDNELFGEAVVKYTLGWALDPYFSASLQTQLTESIKYTQGKRSVSANLWDIYIFAAVQTSLFFRKEIIDKIGCTMHLNFSL